MVEKIQKSTIQPFEFFKSAQQCSTQSHFRLKIRKRIGTKRSVLPSVEILLMSAVELSCWAFFDVTSQVGEIRSVCQSRKGFNVIFDVLRQNSHDSNSIAENCCFRFHRRPEFEQQPTSSESEKREGDSCHCVIEISLIVG